MTSTHEPKSSSAAAAKSASAAAIPGSTGPTSPTCAPRAATRVVVRNPRGRIVGPRAVQRPVADRAADADRRRGAGGPRPVASAARRRPSRSGDRSASTRRPTGSSTAKATCCRRSSSIGTATTSSCRRSRRASTGCCRDIVGMLVEPAEARGHPRAQRRARAAARGLDPSVDAAARRGAGTSCTVREGRIEHEVDLWHGQKTGLFLDQRENRAAARAVRARPAARLLQLPRRLRAAAGRPVRRGDRARRLGGGGRAHQAQRRAQRRRQRRGARRRTCSTTLRADGARPASGSTRSCSTRRPSRRARTRSRRRYAGYKEINLRALKLLKPGGILVTCTCSYHVDEATFGQIVYEAAVDARVRTTRAREADAGARSPGAAGRAGDVLPEVLHPAEARVGRLPTCVAAGPGPRDRA